MNFAEELKNLLEAESSLPRDPLAELSRAQAGILEALYKNNKGISLQVEEIYDIIKESDENARELKSAAKRENSLLGALFVVDDLLDSLLRYIQRSGAGHAEMIAAKRDEAMIGCGLEKLGYVGQQLDPRMHTVASAEPGGAPMESVTRVLESGYMYRGNVVRKATVVISNGQPTSPA